MRLSDDSPVPDMTWGDWLFFVALVGILLLTFLVGIEVIDL